MPHPVDQRHANSKAVHALVRAHKWQETLNERLEQSGHRKRSNFDDVIKDNRKYHCSTERTLQLADKIRKDANQYRHPYK